MTYYDEYMDPECVKLCDTLNDFDGIETTESCCGHLKNNYAIWFRCKNFTDLAILSRAIDKRYCGTKFIWRVTSVTHDMFPKYGFMLECPGIHDSIEEMMQDIDIICENIEYWKNNNFYEYFDTNNDQDKKEAKKKFCITKFFNKGGGLMVERIFDNRKDAIKFIKDREKENKKLKKASLGNIFSLDNMSGEADEFEDWFIRTNFPELKNSSEKLLTYSSLTTNDQKNKYSQLNKKEMNHLKKYLSKHKKYSDDCVLGTLMETYPDKFMYEIDCQRIVVPATE